MRASQIPLFALGVAAAALVHAACRSTQECCCAATAETVVEASAEKTHCEKCEAPLAGNDAYTCSYECTFCADCTEAMESVCPNCSGQLEPR